MAMRVSILLIALTLVTGSAASAQTLRTVNLTGPSGETGTLVYTDVANGPESFTLTVENLQAHNWYTMFLTEDDADGALPGQFVVAFKANLLGKQQVTGKVEIVNAFGSANHGINPVFAEDPDGIAGPGAGAYANGANTNALNYVRIHEAGTTNDTTVFGRTSFIPGGDAALTGGPICPGVLGCPP